MLPIIFERTFATFAAVACPIVLVAGIAEGVVADRRFRAKRRIIPIEAGAGRVG